MADYTMTIKEIIDSGIKIFDGITFPYYDESDRTRFQQMIINHFYFREIGVETLGQFLFNLSARLNEIMPYYNQLYSSTKLNPEILDNYRITETMERTTNDNASNKHLESDAPQGRTSLDEETDGTYVSGIGQDTGSNTGGENWERHMTGSIGIATDSAHIMEYRKQIINVDLQVCKALNDLFMQVY